MRFVLSFAALTLLAAVAEAQPVLPKPAAELSSYLGSLEGYDASIPTPASVLGAEPGDGFYRHDQLVAWFRSLAERSERMKLVEYGRTFEGRLLIAAIFGSPENIQKLDTIRAAHVAGSDGPRPLVLFAGYGVHGNEQSAAQASVPFSYWLAASSEAGGLLEHAIVIVDPCLNPDGHDRSANWYAAHRSTQAVAHREHRERRDPWPGGRLNHFWFDLNRDYLPLVQPESRARMAFFRSWNPDLVGDWHEMGTDSTYFLQPGVPSRNHPLIPADVPELTARIAAHPSAELSSLGSLHFTRQRFDDFYIGKGSTYPDITGSVGLLFEQASSRGRIQTSPFGEISLPFTLRNQVATSIGLLKGAVELKSDLIARRGAFRRSALEEAAASGITGWILSSVEDPERTRLFAELLESHGIRHAWTTRPGSFSDQNHPAGALWVPAAQESFRLARAMLEKRTEFSDSVFYDVSAWNCALAYGLRLSEIRSAAPETTATKPAGEPDGMRFDASAWLIDWRDQRAASLVGALLREGVAVRVSLAPLRPAGTESDLWPAGTLVVDAGIQRDPATARRLLSNASRAGVRIGSMDTRFAVAAPDLGSDDIRMLRLPSLALLAGDGIDGTDAGALWHAIDQRLGLPVILLDPLRLGRMDLQAIDTLVLADGSYAGLDTDAVDAIRRWVVAGGTLVALGRGAAWAVEKGLASGALTEEPKTAASAADRFANAADARARERISGAILAADADQTHPLAFGLGRSGLAVYRDDAIALQEPVNRRSVALRHTVQPLLAGYVSQANLDRLASTPLVVGQRSGRGQVVLMLFNPVFRGFWHGTEKLLFNALLFDQTIGQDVLGEALEQSD